MNLKKKSKKHSLNDYYDSVYFSISQRNTSGDILMIYHLKELMIPHLGNISFLSSFNLSIMRSKSLIIF